MANWTLGTADPRASKTNKLYWAKPGHDCRVQFILERGKRPLVGVCGVNSTISAKHTRLGGWKYKMSNLPPPIN